MVRPDRDTPTRAPVEVATFRSETPRLALVIFALLALVAAYRSNTFALNELAFTFLFAGLATAWNVIGGYGGQFSLANGVFLAIGAYLTANLSIGFGLSPWLSLLPSAACAAAAAVAHFLAGIPSARPLLRHRDHGFQRSRVRPRQLF